MVHRLDLDNVLLHTTLSSDAEVTDSQTLSLKAIKTVDEHLLRKFNDRGQ